MRHLSGDPPERLAAVAVAGAFESVEAGRAVEDDDVCTLGELGSVADGLFLLLEVVHFGDDESRGDLFKLRCVVGAGFDELSEPVDRESFTVDVDGSSTGRGDLDGRRQREVGLPRRWRAVHLRHGTALEPTVEEVVERYTPGGDRLAHGRSWRVLRKKPPVPSADDRPRHAFSTTRRISFVIVVATDDFELYHEAVAELRERGVSFTTVRPDEELPDGTRVVISAPTDGLSFDGLIHVVVDASEARHGVEEALAALRSGDGRTVVGVDPGPRPGIAVLVGDVVVAAFHVPLADAVDVIHREIEDTTDPLVRVGDGDRLQSAKLINELEGVRVEMVDETGTTPYLGTGVRGMGDVLAAVNIARLEGEATESREIEPTQGELQRIKNESRERSTDDRTIDESLARRVAAGELTIDEALELHRGRTDRPTDDTDETGGTDDAAE